MNMLVAIKNLKEIEPLSNLGADEFYCGVKQLNSPSLLFNNNRRCMDDLSLRCNFRSYTEVEKALEIAHSLKKKILVTLNENYSKHQFKQVLKEVKEISKLNVDGLIVTDLNLILELKKKHDNIPIHISMLSSTFNSETVKFYQELGASRIIFPRSIFAKEMKDIREKCPNIELENFIDFFINCPNIEGFCSSIHSLNPLIPILCNKEYLFRANSDTEIPPKINSTCRICNIYDYLKIGIDSLKLTGREYPFPIVYTSLYAVKKVIEIAKKSKSKMDFVSKTSSKISEIIHGGVEKFEENININEREKFFVENTLKIGIVCQKYGLDSCYFQKEVV